MNTGARVIITAAAGTDLGTVEQIHRAADIPDMPDLPMDYIRALLADLQCTRVAWISHGHGSQKLLFAALETPTGWHDLQGNPLGIGLIQLHP